MWLQCDYFQKVSKWERSCELGQSIAQKTHQIWLAKSKENLVFVLHCSWVGWGRRGQQGTDCGCLRRLHKLMSDLILIHVSICKAPWDMWDMYACVMSYYLYYFFCFIASLENVTDIKSNSTITIEIRHYCLAITTSRSVWPRCSVTYVLSTVKQRNKRPADKVSPCFYASTNTFERLTVLC